MRLSPRGNQFNSIETINSLFYWFEDWICRNIDATVNGSRDFYVQGVPEIATQAASTLYAKKSKSKKRNKFLFRENLSILHLNLL